ncbi:MAG: DUF1566 domain-containing protein [Gammaproteobacteria bacterium]|nr:DUF1566 domain-containing protein [Gammaproteobacteria bacterium]
MKPALMLSILIIPFLLWPVAYSGAAQECDNSRKSTADSSRFDINADGTITDIETGLTWQRCAMGQQWNGTTCTGEAALFTWEDAVHAAGSNDHKPDNGKNWRLPRINELAAIVDIRCRSPRINLSLFPKTAAKPFWTTNNVPGAQNAAYTLSFGAEGVARTPKTEKHCVRLVYGRD